MTIKDNVTSEFAKALKRHLKTQAGRFDVECYHGRLDNLHYARVRCGLRGKTWTERLSTDHPSYNELDAVGARIAHLIDDMDDAEFKGWEIIADTSQHVRMEVDSDYWGGTPKVILKRAGGTPKYVRRRGSGTFKGMTDEQCIRYDDWALRNGGAPNDEFGRIWDGSRWRDEEEERLFATKLNDSQKAANAARREGERLTAEAKRQLKEEKLRQEAENRRKALEAKELFYVADEDFGLF